MLMPVACKNELVHIIFRRDVISKTGRPRKLSTIQALNCIFFICRTGCQWSELPCPQGIHFKTVYHRFRTWTQLRVFEDGFYNLVAKYTAQTKLPLVADTADLGWIFLSLFLSKDLAWLHKPLACDTESLAHERPPRDTLDALHHSPEPEATFITFKGFEKCLHGCESRARGTSRPNI